jgi:hypothetical protein
VRVRRGRGRASVRLCDVVKKRCCGGCWGRRYMGISLWRRGCFADGASKNDKERLNARHASEIIKETATHPLELARPITPVPMHSSEPYAILDAFQPLRDMTSSETWLHLMALQCVHEHTAVSSAGDYESDILPCHTNTQAAPCSASQKMHSSSLTTGP